MRQLILFLLFLPLLSVAQNLVPNPSFESDTSSPIRFWPTANDPGSRVVEGWTCPTRATADYFNSDLSFIDFSPVLLAHSGQGRAAVICGLGQQLPESRNYKEYIQAQLLQPLEAGKTYQISFWMALDRAASYTAPGIGAYLSGSAITSNGKERLPFRPQVRYTQLLRSADGWVQVSGTYKASGGEQHLTIGSFSDTAVVPVYVLGQSYWSGSASMHIRRGAYVYIDDVCVAEQTPKGCFCQLPTETEETPDPIASEPPTGPDHYLFLLDASESMGEDGKLKQMKTEIVDFARRLNIGDRLAVMIFAEKPILLFGFSPEHTAGTIEKSLRKLKARGATNGDLALLTAAQVIDSLRISANLHLVLATDGMFSVSARTETFLGTVLSRRNCSLDILHFGTVENKDLLRLTEKQEDGAYFQATSAAIPDIFRQMEPPPPPTPKPQPEPPRVGVRYTDMRRALGSDQFFLPQQD